MSDKSGMSDDELESMLSDLEDQEGGGDLDDADMDGMLSELEQDLESSDSPSPKKEDVELETAGLAEEAQEMGDELDDLDLGGLEGDDDLPVEGGEGAEMAADAPDPESGGAQKTAEQNEKAQQKKAQQKQAAQKQAAQKKKAQSEADSGAETDTASTSTDSETGSSKMATWSLAALKWMGLVLPSVALWWMLGSYLGQWISAGWLIAAVSTAFVIGAPAALYQAAGRFMENRGRFRWWLLGFGIVVTALLVAPMSETAGSALAHYGHWPGQTITDLTNAPFFAEINKTISQSVGGLLDSGAGRAVELGTSP
jgi:hypothetical protein